MKIVWHYWCAPKVEKWKLNWRSGNKNEHNRTEKLIEWQQHAPNDCAIRHCLCHACDQPTDHCHRATNTRNHSVNCRLQSNFFVISVCSSVHVHMERSHAVHLLSCYYFCYCICSNGSSKFTLYDFDFIDFIRLTPINMHVIVILASNHPDESSDFD